MAFMMVGRFDREESSSISPLHSSQGRLSVIVCVCLCVRQKEIQFALRLMAL